jgi:hypothetical protein
MSRFRVAASLAAVAVAAASLTVGTAGAARAASTPAPVKVVQVCAGARAGSVQRGKVMVKPSWLTLACDDDYVYLARLHWSSWSVQARAAGAFAQDGCVPSCLHGRFTYFPALIVLSGGMRVPGHPGRNGYAELTVTFTGTRPAGLPKTIIYKLPLPR